MRIFSDEDADFLSPLLAQGLSKAKPEQLVGVRVSSSAGSGSEPTTGRMYVQKGSIYFTIDKGPKPTCFIPYSAAPSEPAPAYIAGAALGAMTMIIDYHALAKVPVALPTAKVKPITTTAPAMETVQAGAISAGQEVGQDNLLAQKISDLRVIKEALAQKDFRDHYTSQRVGMDEARAARSRRGNESAQVNQGFR